MKVLRDWDERKFSRLPKQPFETLIDLFIKNEKYSNALEVIQMFKDNDNHMIDIEVRLLLKENDINSILEVFREAAILKMNISENVCIIVARKIFELIEKEKKNIEILKDKYSLNKFNNNNVETKIKNFDNNVINNVENNFIENINNSFDQNKSIGNENEMNEIDKNLIFQSESICRNRLLDMEEISNNLLYCERGSTKEFCRNIRMWREGGSAQKHRMEVHIYIYTFMLIFISYLYSIVLDCILLHSIVLYCIVLYCILLHYYIYFVMSCTVLYYFIILYCIVFYCTAL